MSEAPAVVSRFEWEKALRSSIDVTKTRLGVLLALGTYMNGKTGETRVSVATLARDTGYHPGTVRGHLVAAHRAGWLHNLSRGHHLAYGLGVPSKRRAAIPTALSDAGGDQSGITADQGASAWNHAVTAAHDAPSAAGRAHPAWGAAPSAAGRAHPAWGAAPSAAEDTPISDGSCRNTSGDMTRSPRPAPSTPSGVSSPAYSP